MTEEQIRRKLRGIPGLMTPSELGVLIRMARSAKVIMDLGIYKGRSMVAMMLANPDAQVFGVDSFGDMSHRGYKGAMEAQARANLKKLGLEPAGIYAMTTDEAAQEFQGEIDLLHVDAGHSKDEVATDILNWLPKISFGGAVCFHDYGKAHKKCLDRPEVKKAIDEWYAGAPNWEIVERAGVSLALRQTIADEGALYVAYGEKARAGVKRSIASLRKLEPELPIAVVADEDIDGRDYWIPHVDLTPGARDVKTRIYSLSPFKKTLYLDADTVVVGHATGGWRLLDFFDVVLAIDPNKILSRAKWKALDPEEVAATKAEIGTAEVQYYQSGVIFFRRGDNIRRFFQEWHKQWKRWRKQDQMALLRALYRQPVRVAPMRPPWNTHRKSVARFVHHRHRTVARKGAPG